jgi:TolB-like protein
MKNTRNLTITKALIGSLFFLSLILPGAGMKTAWSAEASRVAILPFAVNASDKLDYLKEGLQDMLASRLAWENKVLVLDRLQVQKAQEKFPGPLEEKKALLIGKELNLDYLLWGSATVIGTGISLDVSLADLSGQRPPLKFFSQAKGMDEVIVKVNELSDDINEKVFNRPRAYAAAASRGESASSGTGTAPASPGTSGKSPLALKDYTINALSPQIILNAGGFDVAGVWRSAILPYALRDLAFGDLDGDGKIETVIISPTSVYIYRYQQDKFEFLKEIKGNWTDNYIAVDVADIHGTGRPQIFVTNYRPDGLKSLTLAWDQGNVVTLAKNLPYHLRIHQMPGRGMVLLGQKRIRDLAFEEEIQILSWKDGNYIPVEKISVPGGITVFNFAMVDLNKDGSPEILHLSRGNRLMVLSPKWKTEYTSSDHYGGTINRIQGTTDYYAGVSTIMSEEENFYYIPARILVTSVLQPDQKEIILNKNKSSAYNILSRVKSYSSGEVVSIAFEGASMKENWRTQTIPDYVANYNIADFKNTGQRQLVVGVVQFRGMSFVADARSVLYSYDLGTLKPSSR